MAKQNTGLVLSKYSLSSSSSLLAVVFLVALSGKFGVAPCVLDSHYYMLVSDQVYGFKYWQDGNAFPHGVLGVINSLVLASLSMQGKILEKL